MPSGTVRIMLTLPADLLEATDRAVREGKVRSRNEFVAAALRRELAARRRAEIDADLTEMGNDAELREEALQLEREFAQASWEAFLIGEAAYHGSEYQGPEQVEATYRRADRDEAER